MINYNKDILTIKILHKALFDIFNNFEYISKKVKNRFTYEKWLHLLESFLSRIWKFLNSSIYLSHMFIKFHQNRIFPAREVPLSDIFNF